MSGSGNSSLLGCRYKSRSQGTCEQETLSSLLRISLNEDEKQVILNCVISVVLYIEKKIVFPISAFLGCIKG